MKLNTEQQRAVKHRDGPMLVLAGPGSGKTAVIVNRVTNLVCKEHVDPNSILVLTFSRSAAQQMRERFRSLADQAYPVSFGTFHAIFFHILKSQGLYRTREILTRKRKIELMQAAARQKGLISHKDIPYIEHLIDLVSLRKMDCTEQLSLLEEDEIQMLDTVFDSYNELCRDQECIDFDDMVNDCLKMLKSNDRILAKWQDKYRYILVDEFQDIDKRQYEVLKLLGGKSANIFCVGDDDQSIYSFRGACPDIMQQFTRDYDDLKCVRLSCNYRCPGSVIDHAGRLIRHNKNRFPKSFEHIREDMSPCIEYRCFHTLDEEALYCAKLTEELARESGTTGILYRNSRSGDFIEAVLKDRKLSYRRKDKGDTLSDKEWIRDILAYLRLSIAEEKEDAIRILNRPFRGLSRELIGRDGSLSDILKIMDGTGPAYGEFKKLVRDIGFIKGMPSFAALNYILKGVGLGDYIRKKYFEGDMEYNETERRLFDLTTAFPSVKRLISFFEQGEEEKDYMTNNFSGMIKTELSTIHASKGLEYDNVIITGLQEGLFPGKRCEGIRQLEEERRLFYVAMTRTRMRLFLLGVCRDEYGKRESRFIHEAGFDDETVGSIIDTVVY